MLRRSAVRALIGVGVAALTCASLSAPAAARPGRPAHPTWVTAWTASSTQSSVDAADCPAYTGLSDQTVRNVLTASTGGDLVRVRVTNVFGGTPLHVGHASVAVRGADAGTVPGTMRRLTFRGQASVTVPAGGRVLSDPVALGVPVLRQLAVSVYLPDPTGPVTQHPRGLRDSYLAAGDRSLDAATTGYDRAVDCSMFVDSVQVTPSRRVAGTVVTLGDSITDGTASTRNTDSRWPDGLARRLGALPGRTLSVANAGISGNEILADRIPVRYGPSALHRLDRDVFDVAGVRDVILLEGINDIGAASATADQLIAGDRQLIARAHARGLRVIGATLTPFGGSTAQYGGDYGTAFGEQQRQALNQWIRTSGAFDGVVDFDRATADPADPTRLAPAYDSGDHLHPGDAGYRAMADAVDLSLLR
ncbi:MAG TPA: SGNH/GDSL hydrolase family protein [Actinocatenispora sp.]